MGNSAPQFWRALSGAAVLLLGLPTPLRADIDPHVAQDTFDAEVAALLPAAAPVVTAATIPTDRIVQGDWSSVIPWTPHIPVSAANLPDGRVLTFASNQRTTFPSGPEFTYAATWDPATGQFVEFNHNSHDMFCGALVMLPDGRVLVSGGRNTTVRASIFDWRVNTWTRIQDMNDPRWYNTAVALPNGRVWTVSGSGGSSTAERWESASGWARLPGITWNSVLSEPGYINIWHPFLLLAPDGRLIHFGPTDTMHWVGTDGSGTMSNTGTTVPGTHYPKEGAWVMYDEGRILVAGGGANTTANTGGDGTTGTSSPLAYTVDVRSGTPVVTPTASLSFARQFANAVVLPNGEVLVIGGNTSGLKFNDTGSVLTTEIWNPTSGQWRIASEASVPRNYHSVALVLPDGRVLSGGGGLGGNSADHRDAQIYTPPNLYNPDGSLAPRPTLNTAPAAIGVGTRFTVTGTPGLRRFNFIKMSSITHCVNTDVRLLGLPFTEVSPGTYEITAHASLNVMTPGYWMLFGLNAAGVHSAAQTILVDAIGAVSLAFPGNQSSYIGQPASLALIASGPSGSVYSWTATGLPSGLAINPNTGVIAGTPNALGTFPVHATVTDGLTSSSADFTWTIQPVTFSKDLSTFAGVTGLTLNGNAAVVGNVLRLAANAGNQVGSAFLTDPVTLGPNTSINTRWRFRINGSADGADGLTFTIQGVSPTALGIAGSGLGYDGIGQSVAVEVDNYLGTGDPNANHLAILSNGSVATHLATWTPGWDLEDGQVHTVWVEYDGPSNELRVYAAQGVVTARPAAPVMTVTVDLPALVGGRAWLGFTGATGGLFNNHDIEDWSVSLNAFALPAPPVLSNPGNQDTVLGAPVSLQAQATDPNGDLLTWSSSGLPPGLGINPATGLISGTPTAAGSFTPLLTVTDGNTAPVSSSFTWVVDNLLTVQPLSGSAVAAGTAVSLSAQSSGGLNPRYRWSFGDGTPDTGYSAVPTTTHTFANPGRFLVTVTVRDDTAREVTSSYRQAVYAPPTAGRPTASSSIVYETRAGQNARLWVVNPDNDSVTVFDAVARAKLAEIPVGKAPRTLALAPDGRVWVANTEAASLTILRADYSVAQTVPLPRGSRPFGVVFDPAGANAYVALESGGSVLRLNPTTGATTGSVAVGSNVRHLSITADSSRILASRFVSPPLPGEGTANPQTVVNGVDHGGEVLVIDAVAFAVSETLVLHHSEQPDTSNSGRGIPNYVGAAVISPDGRSAWVPSKQDNIKRGLLRNGGTLTHDMGIRSIASRLDLIAGAEDLPGRIDFDDGGIASAAAFDPNGVLLFTALEGSREIAVVDAWAKQAIMRVDAGRAPQGLVVSPDGRTLFVHNFMDRTVTVHDLTTLANGSGATPPAPAVLNCVATEKLTPTVLLGKQLFYDARDNRLALQQYVSCASCHNDGGQDGRAWDFTQFGEGLRNTITLRGHGGMAQGPLHWTGNFDEVQDFEGQIRNFAGGLGLMSDSVFHAGTRSQPLGDAKAGLSTDLDALAAYVSSLTRQGDSPNRNPDGSLTAAAVAGAAVFQQQNCAQCHAGTRFTDSALGVFHNVGTLKPSSGQRLGATLSGLDTPTLLGLWGTAPYLHDGSAPSLDAAMTAHSGVSLSAAQLSQLTAFLLQLDDTGVTPIPATVTWATPAPITYGTALSVTQLNATASIPGTFTYNPPAGTVLGAAAAQTLSVTFTPSDATLFAPATVTAQLEVRRAALTLTAQNSTKVYGAALPALAIGYSGFVNGDTSAVLTSPASITTTATAASSAGNYPISVSGGVVPNYALSYAPGTLTITRANLTIRADDKTKVSGAPNPPLTATYTGLVNGDTPAALDIPVALSTTAVQNSPEGTYPIVAGGAADANYLIAHAGGTLTITPDTALPPPWVHQDVGSVGLTGDATEVAGTFSVSGSGTDIWNNADGFHFVHQAWTGDGEIVARVATQVNTDPWAKSGVMFRETLAGGSRHVMMVISRTNGAAFQRRTTTDGASTHTAGPAISAPAWVRLVRQGDVFTGYSSTDGLTWTLVGSQTLALPNPLRVGLVVTAHNNTLLNTSTFTDVRLTVPVSPPTIALTAPANGASFTTPASIALAAAVSPNGNVITRVEFLGDGNVLGQDATAPYAFTWTTPSAGNHPLAARAVYGAGVTVTSAAVSVVVIAPPAAPTGLTATATSISQINLAWSAGSADQTGFELERSLDGITFAQIATTTAAITSYPNTGLNASTTYRYRVRAVNSAGPSPYSAVATATTPAVPTLPTVRINFQPSGAPVPSGYLADTGAPFGARGNGYSYGWNIANTANTRDRNSTRSADQRYDTLNHMQKAGGATSWEIALPNGTYQVTIVSGDADFTDSVFRINTEGVLTVSGTPTTTARWVTGARNVTIADGRLTVGNGTGASNNKICFVDIVPATPPPLGLALGTDEGAGANPLALRWVGRDDQGRVTLQPPAEGEGSWQIEASPNLMHWQPVPSIQNADGTVTVQPESEPTSQGYYRAVRSP